MTSPKFTSIHPTMLNLRCIFLLTILLPNSNPLTSFQNCNGLQSTFKLTPGFKGNRPPIELPVDACLSATTIVISSSTIKFKHFVINTPVPGNVFGVNISNNLVEAVPEAPDGCSFVVLTLSGNQISKIGKLSTYKKVRIVDLSHNLIVAVPQLSLPVLEKLDLSNNQITVIASDSLLLTPKLNLLDVSDNQLRALTMCRFSKTIFVNVTSNTRLTRENLMCSNCWCSWSMFTIRCNPGATACGEVDDDFRFLENTTKIPLVAGGNEKVMCPNTTPSVAIAFLVILLCMVVALALLSARLYSKSLNQGIIKVI